MRLLFHYNESGEYLGTETDHFAGFTGFLATFCFGILAHVLSLWRLTRFVETLQRIDAYDAKYGYEEGKDFRRTFFKTKKTMSGFFITAVVMYTPIYMLYKIVPTLDARSDFSLQIQILPKVYIPNPILGSVYLSLGFIILELGVTFTYFQLYHIVYALKERLEVIRHMIEESIPQNLDSSDFFLKRPSLVFGNPRRRSWEDIATQYIEFRGILSAFQDFCKPYFIFMYSVLIVSTVCMTYYNQSQNLVAKEIGSAIQGVVWLGLGRIVDLGDTGYLVQTGYEDFVKSVMKLYQRIQFGDERRQVKVKQ